jgi:hypothetical protein
MTQQVTTIPPESNYQRYLELAIPVLSFGATLLGALLWRMGIEISFQFFSIGCLIGSCILCYLAWIRPLKDIVALSTPIYAIIFFVVPTDFDAGLTLQLLYAASLTILLIRLKHRLGESHTAVTSGKELAAPLKMYVERTHDAVTGISSESAHQAAVVISQFSSGEYAEVARVAGTATGQPEGVLARALGIVAEHALVLEKSLPRPEPYRAFSPEDDGNLAKPLLQEFSDDRKFDTMLDNALLILFSAAWNTAKADRAHLLACQAFMAKLLE